ncbi:MAG: cupredoxin domain-containing protein [Vulcanimicrobiaceae bacterium]
MRSLALGSILLLGGCTFAAASSAPAAAPPPAGGGATAAIDVDLTLHAPMTIPAGTGAGFAPLVTTVAVGTVIRFTNSDSFAHTASSFAGSAFPSASPLGSGALNAAGDRLSTGFTSGNLNPGASSQPIIADVAGTYLFGCFYHYTAPMRAMIVVH